METSDEMLSKAMVDILSTIDPEQATFRQIRDKLINDYHIDTEGKKELILTHIERFFSGADEDVEVCKEGFAEGDRLPPPLKPTPKRGGFAAPVVLSYELSEFMGERVVPRTSVTKKLWEYIKEKNLQNPANKREILCDAVLEKVLKRKKVMMFQMTKIVSTMMKSAKELQANCLYDEEEPLKPSKKRKTTDAAESSVQKKKSANPTKVQKSTVYRAIEGESVEFNRTTIIKRERKESKVHNETTSKTGSNVYVNPALVDLLQLGAGPYKRTQVVSKLWEYIRGNNLQNPADKREILLDNALQLILGVQKCTMFSINKYLTSHIKNLEK